MSISNIAGTVKEINEISIEVNRISQVKKDLILKQKNLEKEVKAYLKNSQEEGIRCGDTLLMLDEKDARLRRNKSDKDVIVCNVLKKYGVTNADVVLKELNDAVKGEQYTKEYLKIKKSKK